MFADKKGQTKKHEKELKLNHCARTVLQCRILNSRKGDVNG